MQKQEELVGKAQTVLGIIDPELLGITLPHEHLLCDLSMWFVEPAEREARQFAHEPVSLKNLYWVKAHYYNSEDNLRLTDEKQACQEVEHFKQAGGKTIVDVSSIGLARNPHGLVRIAEATGLNVVMGTGYYVGASHSSNLADSPIEKLAQEMVNDVLVGVENTGIRAGIIGEIGCSIPLDDAERKVLHAAVAAQKQTGATLSIHPSPDDELALDILKILVDAGADLHRTVICHVDSMGFTDVTIRTFLDAGCYVEYDTFGSEGVAIHSPTHGRVLDKPSDVQRVNTIVKLIGDGFVRQILLSSDICSKHRLTSYGGYGYGHILMNIVPLLRYKGVTEEQINGLFVENPRRILTFTAVH